MDEWISISCRLEFSVRMLFRVSGKDGGKVTLFCPVSFDLVVSDELFLLLVSPICLSTTCLHMHVCVEHDSFVVTDSVSHFILLEHHLDGRRLFNTDASTEQSCVLQATTTE